MRIISSANTENIWLIPETSDGAVLHIINPHVMNFVLILFVYDFEIILSMFFVCLFVYLNSPNVVEADSKTYSFLHSPDFNVRETVEFRSGSNS